MQQPNPASLLLFHGERLRARAREEAAGAPGILAALRGEASLGVALRAAVPVSAARLLLVHSRTYVRAVAEGWPRPLAQSSGSRWTAGVFPAACGQVGSLLAAATEAMRTRGCAGGLAGGFTHARRSRGAAGSTFNGLALAALEGLARGARRVLIIDATAHCGGGTHELVAGHPRIHQLDLAVSDFDRYAPAPGSSVDVVERAADYLPTLRARLDALDALAAECDLCLYAGGMEVHEQAAHSGLRGVDLAMLAAREQLVVDWCHRHRVPLAFVSGAIDAEGLPAALAAELRRLTLLAALARFCNPSVG